MLAPPTLLRTACWFIVLGPLLLAWSMLITLSIGSIASATGGTSTQAPSMGAVAFSAPFGAVLWLATAASPSGFLRTVVPTACTACLYWAAANWVSRARPGLVSFRLRVLAISPLLSLACACTVYALAALVESAVSPPHAKPLFDLPFFPLVAVDATLVGTVVTALWRRHDA